MHKDRPLQKIQDDVTFEQRQKHVRSRRIASRDLSYMYGYKIFVKAHSTYKNVKRCLQ